MTLNHLKWLFRALVFQEIAIQEQAAEDDGNRFTTLKSESNYATSGIRRLIADHFFPRIDQETTKLIREEGFSTFTYIMELSHFVLHLAANSP